MLTVEKNSEEHGLLLTALTAMALRHQEWYKLEADKRNCDHDRLAHHIKMQHKYEQLRERIK